MLRAIAVAIAMLICSFLAGCNLPAIPQFTVAPSPTPKPVAVQEFNNGSAPGDASVSISVPAAPGITQPLNSQVSEWMKTNCAPGNPAANKYPCVTSDANGNACQLGSCLPAEIPGLPPLSSLPRERQVAR